MSTIKTETLSTPSNATVPVDTVVNGTAKAWVNFNGTGTVAIRRAFNVSSITDNSTGNYTVNFTTAMSDANYSTVVSADAASGLFGTISSSATYLTGSVKVTTYNGSISPADHAIVCVSIFS